MLKYAALFCVCLFAGVQCQIQEEFIRSFFKSPEPIPKNYLIAPESTHDKGSFAVAHYKVNHHRPLNLEVQFYILNQNDGSKSKGCSVDFQARGDAQHVNLTSLNRAGSHKLVFTWYDEVTNEDEETKDRRYRVVAVNMHTCHKIDLGVEGITEKPIVVGSPTEILDIFVIDPDSCKSAGDRCRLNYNLAHNNTGFVKPINANLDWKTIQVKRLNSGGLLIVGREGHSYNVMKILPEIDHISTLIRRLDSKANSEFVSSDLSFCFNLDPGSLMTVSCVQYDHNVKYTTLNQDVNIYEDVHLIDVHAIDKGEVVLVVKKDYCDDESCWDLMVAKIKQGHEEAKWHKVTFPCSGDPERLVVLDVKKNKETGLVSIQYVCRNGNGYSFSDMEI